MKQFEKELNELRKELINGVDYKKLNEDQVKVYLSECIDIAIKALNENKTPYQVINELRKDGEIRLY